MQDPHDLNLLGLTPTQPFYDLNLAGSMGVPSPQQLSQPASPGTFANKSDYQLPDFSTPPLQDADLTTPGLTYHTANAPDPLLPALAPQEQPAALTIIDKPTIALLPDPNLPDLRTPDLTPASVMPDRPGDLDPSALTVLDASPQAQLLAHKSYPAVQMDQQGENATMARHLTPLIQGLYQTGDKPDEA